MSITAVVLTKNNEATISSCLASVQWADEVIVYDSGSTDKTVDIAREFNARFIVDLHWQGYGRQRQKAQDHVNSAWVLWLDSDERLSQVAQKEIKDVLSQSPLSSALSTKVFEFPRLSYFMGKPMRFGGWYPDYVARLYPTALFEYEGRRVHEKVMYESSQAVRMQGLIHHDTALNPRSFLEKNLDYSVLWAEQNKYRRASFNCFSPYIHGGAALLSKLFIKLGLLDGKRGVLAAWIKARAAYAKYQLVRENR